MVTFILSIGLFYHGASGSLEELKTLYFFVFGTFSFLTSVMFFGFGIVVGQNRYLMEELWVKNKNSEKEED